MANKVVRVHQLLLAAIVSAGCACRALPPAGDGFLSVPGGPVWYRVVGTGEATPLLVVHGGPGSRSCGMSALAALGTTRRVIFYDQLGSGRSGRPDAKELWRLDRFVAELDGVRRQLGLGHVHLLGHSWGAFLVVAYVLEEGPHGIASLTLSGPLLSAQDWIADADELRRQLPPEVQATLRRNEEAGTTYSKEYATAAQVYNDRFLFHRPHQPRPECAGSANNDLIYRLMWGPSEFFADGTLRDVDVTPRLDRITMPVQFIVGEFDEARPGTVARYQRQISGARLHVIHDAGHVSYIDAPEEYVETVREFLAGVDAAR